MRAAPRWVPQRRTEVALRNVGLAEREREAAEREVHHPPDPLGAPRIRLREEVHHRVVVEGPPEDNRDGTEVAPVDLAYLDGGPMSVDHRPMLPVSGGGRAGR